MIGSCSSLFVGGARSHTIEDACQGIQNLFTLLTIFFHTSLHSPTVSIYVYLSTGKLSLRIPLRMVDVFPKGRGMIFFPTTESWYIASMICFLQSSSLLIRLFSYKILTGPCYLARKHDIDPTLGTPTRNHIMFPEDPTIKKPLNHVNGMNRKVVKMRRIGELSSAPLSNVKRSCTVKTSSLNNLMNERRKMPVSGEKPVVMTKIPFSSFPEIDRDTEMRQVYPSVYCYVITLFFWKLYSSYAFLLLENKFLMV